MGITFPGESAEYRAARDLLLEQEIALRRTVEAVAAARRALPPGGPVPEDYAFQGAAADGGVTDVRLSELFAPGQDSLIIYSFMFPRDSGDERPGLSSGQSALLPLAEGPCPSCVAFLDLLNVFHRDGETVRHFWASELFYAPTDPGQDPRHVGTIEALFNLFDLTPEG